MAKDLSSLYISSSFQRLLQVDPSDGATIINGTGSIYESLTVSGSLTVTDTLFAERLRASHSIIFTSGSTIFGDELTDTQEFTGSVSITGSLTVNGSSVTSFGGSAESSSISTRLSTNETNISTNTTTIGLLNGITGSFATTGSNNFNGTQTITGSILVSGSQTSTIDAGRVRIGEYFANGGTAVSHAEELYVSSSGVSRAVIESSDGSAALQLKVKSGQSTIIDFEEGGSQRWTVGTVGSGDHFMISSGSSLSTGSLFKINRDTKDVEITNNISASAVSASTYYGDGSNLEGIVSGFWTGSSSTITRDSDVQITGSLNISGSLMHLYSEQGDTLFHIQASGSGDAVIKIEADSDDSNEGDNPRIEFVQDGQKTGSAVYQGNNTLTLANSSISAGGIELSTGTSNGYTNAIRRMLITPSGDTQLTGSLLVDASSSNGTFDINTRRTGKITQGYYSAQGESSETAHANKWQSVGYFNYTQYTAQAGRFLVQLYGDSDGDAKMAELDWTFKNQSGSSRHFYSVINNYGKEALPSSSFAVHQSGSDDAGKVIFYVYIDENYTTPFYTSLGNTDFFFSSSIVGSSLPTGDATGSFTGKQINNGLTIDSNNNGYIGINNTAPSYQLDVVGDTNIVGNITASGNISSSGYIDTNVLVAGGWRRSITHGTDDVEVNANGDLLVNNKLRLAGNEIRTGGNQPIYFNNGNITSSYNVSSSATSTASFGTYFGDGSNLSNISTTPFPFVGDAVITGSLTISGSGNVEVHGALTTPTLGTSNLVLGAAVPSTLQAGALRNILIGSSIASNITTGDDNIIVGVSSVDTSTFTGVKNVVVGNDAGSAMTSADNSIILGYQAGATLSTGDGNICIGYQAGYGIGASEDYNISIGFYAGIGIVGNHTVGLGYQAGRNMASYDIAIGAETLAQSSGGGNIGIGKYAVRGGTTGNWGGTSTSKENIGIGYEALYTVAGERNVAIGYQAATASLGADGNVILGCSTANSLTTGDSNIIIGDGVDVLAADSQKQLRIGSGSAIAISASLSTGDVIFSGDITALKSSAATHLLGTTSGATSLTLRSGDTANVFLDFEEGSNNRYVIGVHGSTDELRICNNTASPNSNTALSVALTSGEVKSYNKLVASSSFTAGDSDSTALKVEGSGSVSGSALFEVVGSQGQLFSVTDDLSGTLFEANNISGLPVIQAKADNTVHLGKWGGYGITISGSTPDPANSDAKIFITGSVYHSGSIVTMNVAGSITNTGISTLSNGTHTLGSSEHLIKLDSSGGTIQMTLPSASLYPGRQIFFKVTNYSSAISMTGSASETIDSTNKRTGTQLNLDGALDGISIISDGASGWWVF